LTGQYLVQHRLEPIGLLEDRSVAGAGKHHEPGDDVVGGDPVAARQIDRWAGSDVGGVLLRMPLHANTEVIDPLEWPRR
jgi:hypothetical protein